MLAAAAGLALAGCEPPDQIIRASPPGAALPAEDTGGEAEALGEAGVTGLEPTAKKPLPDLVPAEPTEPNATKTTKSGVKYETVKPGTGPTAKAGDRVSIHYTGRLEDGRKFDSSVDRGKPMSVVIGVGDVILGWDEAVPGMKVGEVRTLFVPPNAGYGATGAKGTIPPNANLKFDVELVSIP